MAEIAKALALPLDFEWPAGSGQKWQLAPLDYEVQAQFERWLEEEAVRAVMRMRPVLGQQEYEAQLRRTFEDIAAHKYDFLGPTGMQAVCTVEGLQRLFWLRLRRNHKDITYEQAREMFADDFVQQYLLPLIKAEDHDPNSASPSPAEKGEKGKVQTTADPSMLSRLPISARCLLETPGDLASTRSRD
jgi:hypothetical protein